MFSNLPAFLPRLLLFPALGMLSPSFLLHHSPAQVPAFMSPMSTACPSASSPHLHSTAWKANETSAVYWAVSQELCLHALGHSCINQDKQVKLCFIDSTQEAHRGSGILPEVTELVSEELSLHQGQPRWLFPGAHTAPDRQGERCGAAVARCPQASVRRHRQEGPQSGRCPFPRAGLACA